MNKLYVIGIGPGSYEYMTYKAIQAMERCEVIIGYKVYTELVKDHFPGKEYLSTPMRKEVERCRMALDITNEGKRTAMICSGDAGIYGMAGLLYEMAEEYPEVELEVISGVTAVTGGAALLGAPLMHDFAVISLSDLLTPWEKIEARIRAAATADFIICFYNPSSRKRKDYLEKACTILLEYVRPEQVCGITRNIARAEENSQICTLEQLRDTKVDMFTTVFIGNSETKQIGDHMVTPRGYVYV